MKRKQLLKLLGVALTIGLACPNANAQIPDAWAQKADFANGNGGVRYNTASFSIGNKGYVVGGFSYNNGYMQDAWEYDPAADSWTQKADYAGAIAGAAGFSIGSLGYCGVGLNYYNNTNAFMAFDPVANTWTPRATFPGSTRQNTSSMTIGNKGYICFGYSYPVGYSSELWQYDPATDSWAQKTNAPDAAYLGVACSIDGVGYAGLGLGNYGNTNGNWYAYDPNTDTWTQKASFAGGSGYYHIAFGVNHKIYAGLGFDQYYNYSTAMWEYDPTTDNWSQKTNKPGSGLLGAANFVIGNAAYIGLGQVNGGDPTEFYQYGAVNVTTWTGTTSKDWNIGTNWSTGHVPSSITEVTIPATTNTPEIMLGSLVSVKNLNIAAGTLLTIDTFAVLHVSDSVILASNVSGPGLLSLNGQGPAPQILAATDTISNLQLSNFSGATIVTGDTLNIKTKYYPTFGVLTINGGLVLLSSAAGTATVGASGFLGNYIVGTVTVQQYIPGRRAYRFLSHPFTGNTPISQLATSFDITGQGGAANGFTTTGTNNASAYWYNPVTASGSDTDDVTGWIPYTSMTDTLSNSWNQFEGLRVIVRGAKGEGLTGQAYTPSAITINMHGTLAQGQLSAPLTTNTNKGYNFIGNPYASPINLGQLTTTPNVGPNFWVWDASQGTAGAYVSQPLNVPYILPAYSGFVVTATGVGASIYFNEFCKSNTTPTSLFKTTGSMGSNAIQLHITSNNKATSWDRLLVYFNDNASADKDALDATKWQNDDVNFYTFSADAKQQSIDVRPYVDGQVIKLGLTSTINQTYSMNVDNMDVPAGVSVSLHDKYLNKLQALHAGDSYSFTVGTDPLSQGNDRFELNMSGTPSAVTNVNAAGNLVATITPNPATDVATLNFSTRAMGNTTLSMTNIIGQQVYDKAMGMQQSGSVSIPVSSMAPGVYIITLHCGDETITKRFVKK